MMNMNGLTSIVAAVISIAIALYAGTIMFPAAGALHAQTQNHCGLTGVQAFSQLWLNDDVDSAGLAQDRGTPVNVGEGAAALGAAGSCVVVDTGAAADANQTFYTQDGSAVMGTAVASQGYTLPTGAKYKTALPVLSALSGINGLVLTVIPVVALLGMIAVVVGYTRQAEQASGGLATIGKGAMEGIIIIIINVIALYLGPTVFDGAQHVYYAVSNGATIFGLFGPVMHFATGLIPLIYLLMVVAFVGDRTSRAFGRGGLPQEWRRRKGMAMAV